jgi:hypothetical protein
MTTQELVRGTYLRSDSFWGVYQSGAAICPDGKVRKLKRIAPHADTFFSVPAAVTCKGRTVTGFVMTSTLAGFHSPTDDDPMAVFFFATGRNAHLFDQEV